ncbi:MAG: SAP domain-containing protein [archaeon]|nr:SAP domain-containing protein [archaeon]
MVDKENRPKLDLTLDSVSFNQYYYLKEELVNFCRENGLKVSGSKLELTERISKFLETGEKDFKVAKSNEFNSINNSNSFDTNHIKSNTNNSNKSENNRYESHEIKLDSIIEENFVCSQEHRAFYKKEIGKGFSFKVDFQKWLKNNAGKTYADSIEAYYKIVESKKKNKSKIGKQFEYNQYIRDFFENNSNKSLNDAIKCWNYKKSIKGHNKYEISDLIALD